ncbi:MAG TPA: MFS transporter [Alphaproteobacteria bacterium]|nr:MFS transporter [Alphaproteobacteria bacterium]
MTDALKTWRTPTIIILAGCLISIVSFGTRAGFGLWLDPMSKSLGWGREVFSLAVAIQVLVWGAAQPFAGLLADKYGNARVLSVGAVLYAVAVYLMAISDTPGTLYLSAGLLLGLGLAGASFSIVLAAFGRMVAEERRSTALGIGTAAGSMGQFLIVPISQFLIARFDWQMALIIASAFPLLIIPLSMALAGKSEFDGVGLDQSIGAAIREAGTHSGYLLLVMGFFVCGFHVTFIQVHLPPYITDAGMDAYVGAWAIAVIGLLNIVGSLTAGVLGDRYSKKYLLSGLYFTRAVAIAVYVMIPPTVVTTLVFAGVMGLMWLSTVPLTSGLVAQMFGPRYMGMLFGFVFFSHQVGAFLGVWLGGKLYDTTGSYVVVWWLAVALGVVAALIHFPINEKRVTRLAEAR